MRQSIRQSISYIFLIFARNEMFRIDETLESDPEDRQAIL